MSDEVKCDAEYPLNEEIDLRDALGTEKHWRWCVYHYTSCSYDGDGLLVACDDAGELWSCSLCHCSCYGPGTDGVGHDESLAAYLASEHILGSYGHGNGIDSKIKELCA